MKRLRGADGFTLVEVLVALGILAFLYSLGAMAVTSVSIHQSVRITADQFAQEIRLAQIRAASEGRPWRITIAPDTGTYTVEKADTCDPVPTYQPVSTRSYARGVAVSSDVDPIEVAYPCTGKRDAFPIIITVTAPDGYSQTVEVQAWAGVKVR